MKIIRKDQNFTANISFWGYYIQMLNLFSKKQLLFNLDITHHLAEGIASTEFMTPTYTTLIKFRAT